ncbi:hypothetical protein BDF19DRAFT_441010 [Syncephalis fuscata]|nr:hypothetical protein BDF19DRAFT_441010 [Syncephalis fuscata]
MSHASSCFGSLLFTMTSADCHQQFQQFLDDMRYRWRRSQVVFTAMARFLQLGLLYIHDIVWRGLVTIGWTTAYTVHLPTPQYHPAVLITGTSTGIGRETALALAQQGYTVLAGVRQKAHGAALAEDFELIRQNTADATTTSHGSIIPIIMDLSTEETIADGWAQVESRLQELNIPLVTLINNAGLATLALSENLTMAAWTQTLWTNFLGAVELTRLALPKLRESRGRIINNGSIASWLSPPGYASYAASKAAMAAWSRSLRNEVIPFGIAVSHLEPGVIITPGPKKTLQNMIDRGLPIDKTTNKALEVYRRITTGLTNLFKQGIDAGMPAQHVVDQIVHAMTAQLPRNKYYIGPDALLLSSIVWSIGETATDWVTRGVINMLAILGD